MRHVMTLFDLSADELREVLKTATELKARLRSGDRPVLLERQVTGLLFEKPSLRTRVSFETLMHQTGGSSLFLGGDVGWGSREPVRDFIPILTSYVDCLVMRSKRHQDVVEACRYSRCPIINGLTEYSHPCQALADILTVQEIHGSLDDIKITFVGDANNVAFSLAVACCRLNIECVIAAPKGYQFSDETLAEINSASDAGDFVSQTDDVIAGVKNANFVYTDVWTSMGQESESAQRLEDLADYQVNQTLMSAAATNAKFLHCLPARRGEEVTSDVIDSDSSAIIQQAENRLHAQKGLVVWLMNQPHDPPA